MKIKILYVILIYLVLLGCSSKKNNTNDITFLKSTIQNQIKNIQTALYVLETQKNGNPASIPYYELSNNLNNILFSNIDTTFTDLDSINIKKKFEQLNILYHQCFSKSQQDPKSKLLKDDADFISSFNFNYIHYNEDLALNYYLSLNRILEKHYQNIYLLGSGASSCHYGLIIDELGYSLVINQKTDTTSILFNQNYYRLNESIKVISFKSILKNNKTIPNYTQKLIDKNTLLIKTPILDTGTYQLDINIESISSKYFKAIHPYKYKFNIK